MNDERLTNAKVPIPYQDAKQISGNEGKHVIKHTRKSEFRTGIFVAAICSLTVENVVKNFVRKSLADNGNRREYLRCHSKRMVDG